MRAILARRGAKTLLAVCAIAAAVVAGTATAARADAPANTDRPTISGTAREGQQLTANPGHWQDANDYAYQWHECNGSGDDCQPISGANDNRFTLTGSQVGKRIRVLVTASGSGGSSSVFSDATDTVTASSEGPVNLELPKISGTTRAGATLTASPGRWNGTGSVSYRYQWLRCASNGSSCVAASQPVESQNVILAAQDVGRTMRVVVFATDSRGTRQAQSQQTAVVAAATVGAPVPTAAPTLSGTPQVGQKLTTSRGTWTGAQPMTFTYEWQRCKSGSCAAIKGATSESYVVTNDDVGFTLRSNVTATNSAGRQNQYSNQLTVAAPAAQQGAPVAGAQRLAGGVVSVPASSVSLPSRLVVSGVSFSPTHMPPGQPVTLTVRITDTRGYVVRDALVYATGVPFGRISQPPETRTGTDGTAKITLDPTARMPRRIGSSLVIFVRARKDGDDVLAGVSSRRLIQVTVGR